MSRQIYKYDGREFASMKALSDYTGVHEKTIQKRLQKGMTVENACNVNDLRCSYHLDGGTKKSISQICRDKKRDRDLIKNRMQQGYTLDEALNRPKTVTKQGKPIVVKKVLYNSIASAVKELGLEEKESTIRRRLKEGMKPDQAFKFD